MATQKFHDVVDDDDASGRLARTSQDVAYDDDYANAAASRLVPGVSREAQAQCPGPIWPQRVLQGVLQQEVSETICSESCGAQ